jgi:Asp-tRNA(Asn)/Glu-tRNA(Gln) amidotransferase A subunit family amidase
MPAVEALAAFRSRRLSPVDVLKAQIARAERVEPAINAFSHRYFESALAQAKRAEDKYMKTDGRPRALEGLTLAVKNEMAVKGQPHDSASLIYKDNIAQSTEPIVERLFRAGAIQHARSNSPEFSCAGVTYSRLYGVTATPWNPKYTCGGSSGGAGACLAAGTATLATGSDIGGSIRIPAAMCGVAGFKPPYGRNPIAPPFNLDAYCHSGPLARTVADCALFQNVTAGPHPRDIVSLRPKTKLPLAFDDIRGKRIAYSIDLGYHAVAPEVRANALRTLGLLRDQGAVVEEVDLGWTREVQEAAGAYLDHLFGYYMAEACREHPDLVTDYMKHYADRAAGVDVKKFVWSYQVAGRVYEKFGPLLAKYHAFVCVPLATHEVRADQPPWEKMIVDGKEIDSDYDWTITYPFNMLSRCPVMVVPSGMGPHGLPTAVQIVARAYDDKRVFDVAAAVERAQPWLDCPERRPQL